MCLWLIPTAGLKGLMTSVPWKVLFKTSVDLNLQKQNKDSDSKTNAEILEANYLRHWLRFGHNEL